ncbi:MAG TPA: hypothetical protein VKP67_06520 [Xanthobacteraceae bacterium]|nr:hypothetical protein [Xanthobacteraceae bacterium]
MIMIAIVPIIGWRLPGCDRVFFVAGQFQEIGAVGAVGRLGTVTAILRISLQR